MKFVCLRYPRLEMTYKPDIKREVNGAILKVQREVIKFENGYYETDDAGKIAFIKRHVDFGNGSICIAEEEKLQSTVATPEEVKIIAKHKGRPKKVE